MSAVCYVFGVLFSGMALSLGSDNPKFWPLIMIGTIWGCTAVILRAVKDAASGGRP